MTIESPSRAGTMESNDIHVMLYPNSEKGIKIELKSIVYKQFGHLIIDRIHKCLEEQNIQDVHVIAADRGALDYTITARVNTAIERSIGGE